MIALIATGSYSPENEVQKAAELIETRYAQPVVFTNETFEHTNAETRAKRFLKHLLNPNISTLWCTRGGEGSADLLPFLEDKSTEIAKMSPKTLIGFSDFTPILVYFAQKYGWRSIHGMGALQFVRSTPDELTLQKTDQIMQGDYEPIMNQLHPINTAAEGIQTFQGELIGGNLTLCSISVKDVWELKTAGKILFFEDWMEKGYRVSRTLKYMQRIGWFDQAKGLLLGDFFAKPLGETPEAIEIQTNYFWKVIQDFSDSLTIPVFHTTRIGHGKANDPITLNQSYQLVCKPSKVVESTA